jgi:alpha-glucosidase
VRSFADSNGDGVGDLPGVLSKLEYLDWLGVDTVWLSPTFPSPNVDWGYDVADYYGVQPDFGTHADLDQLITEARARDMRIMLDLVPNHTSDRHQWFRDRPEFYVWADEVQNHWRCIFNGGPAWKYDDTRAAYYLHQFAPQQPDLDWWNLEVRAEFERILRFWFDRGVGGIRIDVAHSLIKDKQLRDPQEQYAFNQPEVHEIYQRWQRIAQEYDPKPTLMGETSVELDQLFAYYGTGTNELDLAQNFPFIKAPFERDALCAIVEEVEATLPPGATPVWFGSNHDNSRLATRWADGDERKARAALFLLLTLRGAAILYQGDEIAMVDTPLTLGQITDIAEPPRDPERTPLPWTRGGAEWPNPWLPLGDTQRNVEDQRADPSSTLNFVRALIERRREFAGEPYRTLPSSAGVWAFARGKTTIALNMTDEVAEHDGSPLEPWQGLIF